MVGLRTISPRTIVPIPWDRVLSYRSVHELASTCSVAQDAFLFESLDEGREITYEWMESYNERRPHDALGGLPPVVYRERITREVSPSQVYS